MLRYAKAIAAAVASFGATLGLVWQDEAITLDELGVLKAAAVAVLVAAGVYAAPKNQP